MVAGKMAGKMAGEKGALGESRRDPCRPLPEAKVARWKHAARVEDFGFRVKG